MLEKKYISVKDGNHTIKQALQLGYIYIARLTECISVDTLDRVPGLDKKCF